MSQEGSDKNTATVGRLSIHSRPQPMPYEPAASPPVSPMSPVQPPSPSVAHSAAFNSYGIHNGQVRQSLSTTTLPASQPMSSSSSSSSIIVSVQPAATTSTAYAAPKNASARIIAKLSATTTHASQKVLAKKQFMSNTMSDWFSDEETEGADADPSRAAARSQSELLQAGGHSGTSLKGDVTSLQSAPLADSQMPITSRIAATLSQSNILPAVIKREKEPAKKAPAAASGKEVADVVATSRIVIHQTKGAAATKDHHVDEWTVVPSVKDVSVDERTAIEITSLNSRIARIDRFKALLAQQNVDLEKLRKLSWNGIPDDLRGVSWQLLMGYLPCNLERREIVLQKKRKDYHDYVRQSFGKGIHTLDQIIYHQIHIDVPRTNPAMKLYQEPRIQSALERILYCWAIRHPASGYVQGINDLATPFFQTFLSAFIPADDLAKPNIEALKDEQLDSVEADTFWCLSKLLDGIQDNYTHAQPGILRQIQRMKELIGRIDVPLYAHIQAQGIDFIQFAFRWINCLLMREVSMSNVVRMWDTYLAEGPDGFSEFHTYVCAAFLAKWSEHLRKLDFQEIMIFLQCLPTKEWGEKEIEVLLSEAFMWKSLFHNAPSHFTGTPGKNNPSEWSI